MPLPIFFFFKYCSLIVSFPVDHHLSLFGGPTEVLVDWGHRTTLISSPESSLMTLLLLYDTDLVYGCRVLKPGIVHLLHVDARTAAEEGFGGGRRAVLSSALTTWPGDTFRRRRRQTPSSAGRRYDRPHPNAKCRQSVHCRSIILCLYLCRKRFFRNLESGSCAGNASPNRKHTGTSDSDSQGDWRS